jgi:hypothetical protein
MAGRWVRGQKRDRARYVLGICFVVFSAPRRETPKNVIKTTEEKSVEGFCLLFCNFFRYRLFCKRFLSIFALPSLRST